MACFKHPFARTSQRYADQCRSALAIAYGVSPFAARWAIFRRISICFGCPILMPLAFARAIPAFVRSLIFCASNFAKDESNARRTFLLARCRSLSEARYNCETRRRRRRGAVGALSFAPYPRLKRSSARTTHDRISFLRRRRTTSDRFRLSASFRPLSGSTYL